MAEEQEFYRSYSYGNRHDPGQKIVIEHNISFMRSDAELAALISQPAGKLEKMREASIEKEKAIFQKLNEAATGWDKQAAQTLRLDKALEYARTPKVSHSSNKWVKQSSDWWEISNLVYKMRYHIYTHTEYNKALGKSVPCAWTASWSLYYNAPRQPERYSYSPGQIAGQEKKKFTEQEACEKYIQGRVEAYSHLFIELSPPVPDEVKRAFSVNGHLLPGYRLESQEVLTPDKDKVLALLSFVEEADFTPAAPQKEPEQKSAAKQKAAKQKKRSVMVR